MEKQYVMFSIINSTKAYKKVKIKLREIGYNRFTAIDSVGASEYIGDMEFSTRLATTLSEMDNQRHNKTVILVLPNEEEVVYVMDELEKILHMDPTKPGKGIMFTFPIITCQGVRFEDSQIDKK